MKNEDKSSVKKPVVVAKKPVVNNQSTIKPDSIPPLDIDDYKQRLVINANKEKIEKSYSVISKMWNNSDISRKFVKHLMSSFIPQKHINKIIPADTKISCCVLNEELVSISSLIVEYGIKNPDTLDILNKLESLITEEDNKVLIEVAKSLNKAHAEFSYYFCSENSDKFLSKEASMALGFFAQNMLISGNSEISNVVRKIRLENEMSFEDKALEQKRLKEQKKCAELKKLENTIDSKSMNALEKFKASLV